MKIIIDDITMCIEDAETGEVIFSNKTRYGADFHRATELILTPAQLYKFISKDTARSFTVSAKKLQSLLDYMV